MLPLVPQPRLTLEDPKIPFSCRLPWPCHSPSPAFCNITLSISSAYSRGVFSFGQSSASTLPDVLITLAHQIIVFVHSGFCCVGRPVRWQWSTTPLQYGPFPPPQRSCHPSVKIWSDDVHHLLISSVVTISFFKHYLCPMIGDLPAHMACRAPATPTSQRCSGALSVNNAMCHIGLAKSDRLGVLHKKLQPSFASETPWQATFVLIILVSLLAPVERIIKCPIDNTHRTPERAWSYSPSHLCRSIN